MNTLISVSVLAKELLPENLLPVSEYNNKLLLRKIKVSGKLIVWEAIQKRLVSCTLAQQWLHLTEWKTMKIKQENQHDVTIRVEKTV